AHRPCITGCSANPAPASPSARSDRAGSLPWRLPGPSAGCRCRSSELGDPQRGLIDVRVRARPEDDVPGLRPGAHDAVVPEANALGALGVERRDVTEHETVSFDDDAAVNRVRGVGP